MIVTGKLGADGPYKAQLLATWVLLDEADLKLRTCLP